MFFIIVQVTYKLVAYYLLGIGYIRLLLQAEAYYLLVPSRFHAN